MNVPKFYEPLAISSKRATGIPSATVPAAVFLLAMASSGLAAAQTTKTFIDYLKPTPITCSALSSATWGVAGVLPRDLCNGIESAKGAAVPPDYYYWDGQIIKAKDGKYHMFMSTWSGSAGFNPGWTNSDAYHAISDGGVLGQYQRQGFVYTNGSSHKGHNVSALELMDGTYAVVVSEIVPFTIYKSNSLDGPWTGCTATIQPNGVKTNSTVACNPGGPCNDSHWDSNVSLVARPDGKFEIVQRHGFIALADTLCGPYAMQKPTWTYPQANLPNVDSIYPTRTSIPGVSNPTYGWEEDPHIWYSAGTYHVLYSGSGDRVGWHLYSTDGIHNWKDGGLAFNPRQYQKIFCYEGSTTCSQWYKMERPGVVLQDGHPTHITWAVADVDKDNQIPAGSNHGSKVIVVPFDGVAFDNDYGVGGSGGAGGTGGGGGGRGGTGGGGGRAGTGGGGGRGGTGGSAGSGGAIGTGGTQASGGRGGAAGSVGGGAGGGAGTASGVGGAGGAGGGPGGTTGAGTGGNGGSASGGAGTTGGGATNGRGGAAGNGSGGGAGNGSGGGNAGSAGAGGTTPNEGGGASSGCSCELAGDASGSSASLFILGLVAAFVRRRRNTVDRITG